MDNSQLMQAILANRPDNRLTALESAVRELRAITTVDGRTCIDLVEWRKGIDTRLGILTEQIGTLGAMITYLGTALTASGALPPAYAIATRDAMRAHIEPDAHAATKALGSFLDNWVAHPSVSGTPAAPDSKPRLTLVST